MSLLELDRDNIRVDVLRQLVRDLRRPPEGFPEFNMDVLFNLGEDGRESGDLCAYIMARALGGGDKVLPFIYAGGDLMRTSQTRTGLYGFRFQKLVYPEFLLAVNYPLHTVTNAEAASLVESFIESGCREPDYYPLLEMYFEDIGVPSLGDIPEHVDQFLAKYGGPV